MLREKRRKREAAVEEEIEKERKLYIKKRKAENDRMDSELEMLMSSASTAFAVAQDKERKERTADCLRDKTWWEDGYRRWDDSMFQKTLRMNKQTFEDILSHVLVRAVV